MILSKYRLIIDIRFCNIDKSQCLGFIKLRRVVAIFNIGTIYTFKLSVDLRAKFLYSRASAGAQKSILSSIKSRYDSTALIVSVKNIELNASISSSIACLPIIKIISC